MILKRVGIVYDSMKKEGNNLANKFEEQVNNHGIATWRCLLGEKENFKAQVKGTDLILSIGGDGTILSIVQTMIPNMIPITAINLGSLGFMTEFQAIDVIDKLSALLAGEGWIDERSMLEVEISGLEQRFHALNDLVVAHKFITQTISIKTDIDGEYFTTYQANGIIVATATGSTAYSLSIGGPILYQHSKELILIPIMPHLSITFPLVLPPKTAIKMGITTNDKSTVSIDGQINLPISSEVNIIVRLSKHKVKFLRINPECFYGSLAKRLKLENSVGHFPENSQLLP